MRHTVSNNSNLLPFKIIAPVPSGGMHHLALEVIEARDVRVAWQIELADGGDEEVGGDGIRGSKLAVFLSRKIDSDFPFRFCIFPTSFFHS